MRTVDVSLQSELSIIAEISRIAERVGRIHDIILMIDLGDLREGIWPHDLVPTVEKILEMPGVRLAGIGTNLTCFGAIVPTEENLGQLVAHAYTVERLIGRPLDYISGGNSSSLPLLLEGRLPPGVSNLRIGEAILQGGIETFRDEPWTGAAVTTRSGSPANSSRSSSSRRCRSARSGFDAFGNEPLFVDEGDRLRGIANIGREDVIVDDLTPIDKGVRVLGASSDHLMLDVTMPTRRSRRRPGCFRMNYGALLPSHDVRICREGPGSRRGRVRTAGWCRSPPIHRPPRARAARRRRAAGGDGLRSRRGRRRVAPAGRLVRLFRRRPPRDAEGAGRRGPDTHSLGLIWFDSIARAPAYDDGGTARLGPRPRARADGADACSPSFRRRTS